MTIKFCPCLYPCTVLQLPFRLLLDCFNENVNFLNIYVYQKALNHVIII